MPVDIDKLVGEAMQESLSIKPKIKSPGGSVNLTAPGTQTMSLRPEIMEIVNSSLASAYKEEVPNKEDTRDLLPISRRLLKRSKERLKSAQSKAFGQMQQGPGGVARGVGTVLSSAAGATGDLALSALTGMGAGMQRSESSRVDALRLAQGKGLPPKGQISEFGDVYAEKGFGPTASATLGLATEVASDPLTYIGNLPAKGVSRLAALLGQKSLGTATRRAASKTVAKAGERSARTLFHILRQNQPEVVDFLVEDGYRALTPKYARLNAVKKPSNSMIEQTTKYFYKPANEAYESVVAKAGDKTVDGVDDLVERLSTLADEAVASELEISRVNKAISKLKKSAGIEEGASLVDEFGRPMVSGAPQATKDSSLKELLRIQRDLRKSAKNSVVDADAARLIGDHLVDQFDELAGANSLWREYADVARLQDAIIGKTVKEAGETRAKNSANLATLLDRSNTGINTMDRLAQWQNLINKKSSGAADNILLEAQRISTAKKLIAPESTRGISNILIGGLEKGAAKLGRIGSGTVDLSPRARALRQVMSTTSQLTLDPGIARVMTGREDVLPLPSE